MDDTTANKAATNGHSINSETAPSNEKSYVRE
jgi:hypothetical protein